MIIHFLSFAAVMMPAYALNRTYAIFFVLFSVIGKSWFCFFLMVTAAAAGRLCC